MPMTPNKKEGGADSGGEGATKPPAPSAEGGPKAAKGKMPTNADITKMGSPQDIAKDPKKMKALQDIIKKIMGVKKGKKAVGAVMGGKKPKMVGEGSGEEKGNG